jgi:hypothetical protein
MSSHVRLPTAEPSTARVPTLERVQPKHGPSTGGVEITLIGKDLDSRATIRIGALNCELVKATATLLSCTLPAGRGANLDVSYVTVDRTTKILKSSFSYDEVLIRAVQPASIVWANTLPIDVNITVAALPSVKLDGMRVEIGDRDCTNLKRVANQVLACTFEPFDPAFDTPLSDAEDPPTIQLSIDGLEIAYASAFEAPIFVADAAASTAAQQGHTGTKDAQSKAISTSERYLMQGLGLAAAILCIAGCTGAMSIACLVRHGPCVAEQTEGSLCRLYLVPAMRQAWAVGQRGERRFGIGSS